ncbi:DASH complex subunit Spc19, partial [Penicillium pulvis]|uniref:DASH complex subunit Spc19 n=1 Tax=Penicillium pulvis TaxID=1562058 RepID=UPI002547CFB6
LTTLHKVSSALLFVNMASSLASSVSSLQSSLQLLDNSITILDEGVNDFPRLCKVLQTTRHFELLPEPTLREAQQSLLDEITPSIAHLLSLASNHVEKLARREEGLKAKCDLQEGRLSSNPENRTSANRVQSQSGAAMRGRLASSTGNAASKAAELRRLVQKKERLKYVVDRLELQSTQRQRQLRKSMAAQ